MMLMQGWVVKRHCSPQASISPHERTTAQLTSRQAVNCNDKGESHSTVSLLAPEISPSQNVPSFKRNSREQNQFAPPHRIFYLFPSITLAVPATRPRFGTELSQSTSSSGMYNYVCRPQQFGLHSRCQFNCFIICSRSPLIEFTCSIHSSVVSCLRFLGLYMIECPTNRSNSWHGHPPSCTNLCDLWLNAWETNQGKEL